MVATKHSAKQRRKGSSRAAQLAKMRERKAALAGNRKEAEGAVAATPPAVSIATPVADVLESAPSASLRKLGTPTPSEPSSESCSPSGYAIIDLTVLASLFTAFRCSACGAGIELTTNPSSRRGFAHHLSLTCKDCGCVESSTMTSKTLDSGSRQRHYEVNRKMVLSFLEAGVGFSGLQTICETMGMAGISQATYNDHLSDIHKTTESAKKELMDKAEGKIRAAHNTPTGVLDLAVSFDGSWQKRGHTSKHGIAAVIEATTGLVIDYHVMATFCQPCSSVGAKKRRESQDAYEAWYATHKPSCTANHEGSSGMMEVEASRVMWERSMARNMRYTTLISDGDSKTHNELLRLDPYPGTEVVKEECTNHVAKRFGTGCRNLVAAESKKGNTLGGRKIGALTQQKIGLLQAHYKRAVASKCTSTTELRKKILRTLKHCSSSDDNPQHDDCPAGKDSWCFYQRALAYGRPPPSHQGKSSCFLNPHVAEALKPLYERLTTEALLSRCLKGLTQNANESLHSQVWQRCPKHLFAGRKRIEVATFSAVASFNCGSAGLHHFITAAGCSLNHHTITKGYKRDSRRVTQAERRQHSTWKRRRLEISIATSRAQQEYEKQEGGPAYASGAF